MDKVHSQLTGLMFEKEAGCVSFNAKAIIGREGASQLTLVESAILVRVCFRCRRLR